MLARATSHAARALRTTIVSSIIALAACAATQPPPALPLPPVPATEAAWLPVAPLPDPDTIDTLSLDDLLVWADAHAPAVLTARAHVAIADAEIDAADLPVVALPELTLGAGARHVDGAAAPELGVELAQQVELGGVRTLRVEAARVTREAADARVDVARWAVHVEVHRLFVDLLLAAQRVEQTEQFVAFSQSLRDIAARQVEAGESSPMVLLVADADLAASREGLLDALALQRTYRARLAGVIGWPGELPPITGTLPPIAPSPDPDALLATMSAAHPALRARDLAVAASRADLDTAARDGRVEPTFGVGYDREGAPGTEPDANIWRAFVTVPLPTWRANRGAVSQANARLLVASHERDEAAAALRADLFEAVIALDAAAARVALYDDTIVPSLEQNLAQLQRAWELGEVDVHQVSQTRQRLLDATRHHLDARVAWYETAATLEGLVGSELWPDREDP